MLVILRNSPNVKSKNFGFIKLIILRNSTNVISKIIFVEKNRAIKLLKNQGHPQIHFVDLALLIILSKVC